MRTDELGMKFKEGAIKGRSSRTQIIDSGKSTLLVDYGWAILGKRDKKSGKITYYSGWDKYSPSTSKHISQLSLRSADVIIGKSPQLKGTIKM